MSIHDVTKEKVARPPTATTTTTTASSSGSGGSLRPRSPPSSSEPDKKRLIDHLLAAKRSLTAISDVWRANELVTRAQEALEESVVLAARTSFINTAVASQIAFLTRVRTAIEDMGRKGHLEFEVCSEIVWKASVLIVGKPLVQAVLHDLDKAGSQLKHTLDHLRSTALEPSVTPLTESRKSLLDFVDEDEVHRIHAQLDTCIEQTQGARLTFAESIKEFDEDLKSVKLRLEFAPNRDSKSESPVPAHLQALESHATELAGLLESLVRHFDFCVRAVKQTEHASTPVLENLASSMPEGVDIHLSTSGPLTPTTEEERAAMLSVIDKDANEVDDVVLEIQDRLGEMESTYQQVLNHTRHLADTQQTAIESFHQLESIQSKLPSYVQQSQHFLTAWELQASEISTHHGNLLEMREFYAGFLTAYHGLVVEVKRRRNCESRMEGIMKDAMAKIERLYQEDVDERQSFRSGNAFYLPADIWPGLEEPPMRFAVRKQTVSTARLSTAKE